MLERWAPQAQVNAVAGLSRGLHCSRLSSYPLADAGKAGSTYSAYSNDIQKADFAVLWQKGVGALKPTQRAILSYATLVRPNNHKQFESDLKISLTDTSC